MGKWKMAERPERESTHFVNYSKKRKILGEEQVTPRSTRTDETFDTDVYEN